MISYLLDCRYFHPCYSSALPRFNFYKYIGEYIAVVAVAGTGFCLLLAFAMQCMSDLPSTKVR